MADLVTPPGKTWLTGKRFEQREDVIGFDLAGGNDYANVQQFHPLFETQVVNPPLTDKRFERLLDALGLEAVGGSLYPKVNLFLTPVFARGPETKLAKATGRITITAHASIVDLGSGSAEISIDASADAIKVLHATGAAAISMSGTGSAHTEPKEVSASVTISMDGTAISHRVKLMDGTATITIDEDTIDFVTRYMSGSASISINAHADFADKGFNNGFSDGFR